MTTLLEYLDLAGTTPTDNHFTNNSPESYSETHISSPQLHLVIPLAFLNPFSHHSIVYYLPQILLLHLTHHSPTLNSAHHYIIGLL